MPSPISDPDEHPCVRDVHRWKVIRSVLSSEPELLECHLCGHKIDASDRMVMVEQIRKFHQQISNLRTDADGLLTLASAAEGDRVEHQKLMQRCMDRIEDVRNVFTGMKLLDIMISKM